MKANQYANIKMLPRTYLAFLVYVFISLGSEKSQSTAYECPCTCDFECEPGYVLYPAENCGFCLCGCSDGIHNGTLCICAGYVWNQELRQCDYIWNVPGC